MRFELGCEMRCEIIVVTEIIVRLLLLLRCELRCEMRCETVVASEVIVVIEMRIEM